MLRRRPPARPPPQPRHDPDAGHSAAPATPAAGGPTKVPPGWSEHDVAARDGVRRYLGNLAPARRHLPPAVVTKLAGILGVEDDYPELEQKPSFVQVPQLVLTDALSPVDARKPTATRRCSGSRSTRSSSRSTRSEPPVAGAWLQRPVARPDDRVNQGDKVRAEFTNNLKESTGVHFHGVEFEDFFHGWRPVRDPGADRAR